MCMPVLDMHGHEPTDHVLCSQGKKYVTCFTDGCDGYIMAASIIQGDADDTTYQQQVSQHGWVKSSVVLVIVHPVRSTQGLPGGLP